MPKGLFEQFIKKQEEKLDKAEKMVEGVEGRLKTEEVEKKIEEFIEKSVKKLKKLWEKNEKQPGDKDPNKAFSFFSSLFLPETPPFLLERTSNKFLKEFDWEKFEGRGKIEKDLGLFLSAFLKKNIENYVLSQKKKGIKKKDIKPIEVHLKAKEVPIILDELGFQNPKKLYLIIEGNCRHATGEKMQGGKIVVKGDCGCWIGASMQGGKMVVKGDCDAKTGLIMQGGKMIIEGDCGDWIGLDMQDGELIIKGEVVSFDRSAFSSNNQGTIIWKNTKIWENGNWTKEGKEMWEKGEIPVR